mmetsp:Transcript_62528/g.166329  ORF Transcript_62528/g.166329 Transcript_62528/m.166329 type:complete len:202 (+) Transcript_62528:627-1232(+)
MTSPRHVSINHAGSKRFDCIAAVSAPTTGSREKKGSRPSSRRTLSAVDRYSRFTAAAGSTVGATRMDPAPSRTSAHMKLGWGSQPRLREAMLTGMFSTFQPMPYSARNLSFSSRSRFVRAASSSLSLRSTALASLSPSAPVGRRACSSSARAWTSSPARSRVSSSAPPARQSRASLSTPAATSALCSSCPCSSVPADRRAA